MASSSLRCAPETCSAGVRLVNLATSAVFCVQWQQQEMAFTESKSLAASCSSSPCCSPVSAVVSGGAGGWNPECFHHYLSMDLCLWIGLIHLWIRLCIRKDPSHIHWGTSFLHSVSQLIFISVRGKNEEKSRSMQHWGLVTTLY